MILCHFKRAQQRAITFSSSPPSPKEKKMSLKLVFVVVLACLVTQILAEDVPLTRSQQQQQQNQDSAGVIANARKLRQLAMNPGVIRLYRILAGSGALPQSLDKDDLLLDDESYLQKRQYDDYGHMRFGKRNTKDKDFDDYGHMRFGRK